MTEDSERTEGWGGLDNVRNAHYFKDGRSLCRKWLVFGEPRWEKYQDTGEAPTKGTCKACWRQRKAEEWKTAPPKETQVSDKEKP